MILTFVVCWTPLQIVLALDAFTLWEKSENIVWFQIASNCLAYMNSVANPVIYTLLSAKFRQALRRVTLCDGNRGGDANVVVVMRRADQPDIPLRTLYRSAGGVGVGGGGGGGGAVGGGGEVAPSGVCGGGNSRTASGSPAAKETAITLRKDEGKSTPPSPRTSIAKENSK